MHTIMPGQPSPAEAPRGLHEICEDVRRAECGHCCAMPGESCAFTSVPVSVPVTPGTPLRRVRGYHVNRFAIAEADDLISIADLSVVLEGAGAFTSTTVIYDDKQEAAMSDSQAPRQKGHPCPPWCAIDHGERIGLSQLKLTYHGSRGPMISTPSGYVNASAYQDGFSDAAPQIALTCLSPGAALLVDACDSEKLAAFVEQLADATPDQHRELAAAIRQAAADITEAEQ